jgi:hypothetical protein
MFFDNTSPWLATFADHLGLTIAIPSCFNRLSTLTKEDVANIVSRDYTKAVWFDDDNWNNFGGFHIRCSPSLGLTADDVARAEAFFERHDTNPPEHDRLLT